jgi:hypothetical protein
LSEEGHSRKKERDEEMKRRFILAIVIAVVIVLAAKYFGLLSGPAILGGHSQVNALLALSV